MKRRNFLAASTALGSALYTGCRSAPQPQAGSGKPFGDFELDGVALAEIGTGLRAGKWTSHRLVELYYARTEAIDRNGPRLGAIIEWNPDAEALAAELDRERKGGHERGPLHGIPILLKDNIDTGDRMSTSAGSLALENWHAPKDAVVAARLRAAGALILGKTNLSEWANFRSTHSTSGWSGRGGQTRNPYALDRCPSGSSSGSAVAAAASLCAGAIGTETDGSITSPSSINGLVGIKPTVGLISRSGIIPISASQDTAGPITRTVRDAAMLLSAMTGIDPQDPSTVASASRIAPDYTRFLDPAGLRGARLGIARKFFDSSAPLDRYLSSCVEALKKAGAEVIDPADLPALGQIYAPELEVLLYEFKDGLNRYLSRLPAGAPARSLKELIDYDEKYRPREMPIFEQELFVQSEAKGPLTEEKYAKARADCLRLSRQEGVDAVIAKHNLDAIVTLTSGPAWYIDTINGDRDTGNCTTPAAVAGYPHVTVPAGLFRGLPIGLSFFGGAWSEPILLKLAYAWEQQTKAREKPTFRATAQA
jgi:amidase